MDNQLNNAENSNKSKEVNTGVTMSRQGPKDSVFVTYEDDIKKLYKTEEEREKVRKILKETVNQSNRKEILSIREVKPLKKFISRWKLRFVYGVHWKKPFYPFRLARNMFLSSLYRALGLRKYVFRGIEFAITFDCNFSCIHCLCSRIVETDKRRELEPSDYKRIVKEAMKMGATTFGLEGGEPLIKKNWPEVIKAFKPKYNHVIISTNGYMLNEEKLKLCADLGVDTINFSLDSGIPELHDLFRRKKGCFDRVVDNIMIARRYGIKPLINTVVHKGNLYTDGLIKLFEFAENNQIMLNVLYAKGVGEFKDKDSMLDDEDFSAYKKISEPYAYVHIHHEGDLKYNYGGLGCPGTKEMFNLTPYGDVMNCANMHIYMGNVLEEPLSEIRKRALKESPFGGKYNPCFLTMDKDFMEIYYPILENKMHVSLDEFKGAVKEYEKKNNKEVFPEMIKG